VKKVIGFGALNVDNIFKVKNLLLEENSAYPIDVQAGGSAANTIIGLAKLGIPCGFVGIVANDAYGKLLLSEFKTRKIDTSNIIIRKSNDLSQQSGLVEAFVDKKGRRLLFVKPGVNSTLKSDEIDLHYLKKTSILHISSFVDNQQFIVQKNTINKLDQNIKLSFSPGSLYCERGLKEIAPIIKKSSILFLDRKEIYQLTRRNYKKASLELLKMGPKIVAVTLGKEGCFIATRKQQFQMASKKVKVLDTTGAGDAFAAGFLYGLIKEVSISKCAEIGNTVAGFSISKVGARPGLPSKKELSLALKSIK
jgi:ribokinase